MLSPTSFGSMKFLIRLMRIYKTTSPNPRKLLPEIMENIAQGIIAVPVPIIGRRSSRAIRAAAKIKFSTRNIHKPIQSSAKVISSMSR